MRALFFDPYLDTLGGGERYCLFAAQTLKNHAWDVTFAWSDKTILPAGEQRFGLDLSAIEVDADLFHQFSQANSLYSRRQIQKNFDLIFWVSDGSVPFLFGKKNLLHYQVPFTRTNSNPVINQLKLLTIDKIIVNSQFTKQVIDRTLHSHKSVVLYPPVDVETFGAGQVDKQNLILNVGRFASPSHSKRQDVLINAFRQLCQLETVNWKLILAGGHQGDEQILQDLKQQAQGLNIEFVINPDYRHLIQLYKQASIYWHAAGFEVDEVLNPESVEHFGITTVEAMAAGSVPVVIGKGGQKEIVDIDSGFQCLTIDDIVIHTQALIKNPQMLSSYSAQCRQRADQFSQQEFARKFLNEI